MTPNSWLTILGFFLFIAPGLLFDLIGAHRKVPRKESTFTEISRVALVSTVCSVAAFATVLLFAAVCARQNWQVLPVPSAMLKQGNSYIADNLVRISVTAIAIAALALIFAALLTLVAHSKKLERIYATLLKLVDGKDSQVFYDSAWHRTFKVLPPQNSSVHVRVTLTNGTVWSGGLRDFSPDMEVADRELVLQPPIMCKPTHRDADGKHTRIRLDDKWQFVILRGSDIVSIAVSYEAVSDTTASSDTTPVAAAAHGSTNALT